MDCNNEDKPKDKSKVIDMMKYISQKSVDQGERLYSKEDIQIMFKNISLDSTYTDEMANDFITSVVEFYFVGLQMGMSPFIARAAMKELLEIAFMIAEQYADCDGDCENCEHKDEHHKR